MPTNDDSSPAKSQLSPEVQKRVEAFHQNIAKALCANLNRNVLAESEREVQLIASTRDIPT
jgi:hypothetical protein